MNMTGINIHHVVSIELSDTVHRVLDTGEKYTTREITITDDKGHRVCIDLFSEVDGGLDLRVKV